MSTSSKTPADLLWEELTGGDFDNPTLRQMIQEHEVYREVAGKQLLQQNPTEDDLRFLMEFVPSLADIANEHLVAMSQ